MSLAWRPSMLRAAAISPLRSTTVPISGRQSRFYAEQEKNKEADSGEGPKHSGRTPPGPKDGAKPKILDSTPDANPSEDVKKHNEDFEKRHDRAEGKINPDGKENVGKGFWSGKGGVDKQP